MQELVDLHWPQAHKIRLVCDNLNIHSPTAFYDTFTPGQARDLTRLIEFHYTPKHSSWLNMAEVEIAVLSEKCLDRRLGQIDLVETEVRAWQVERNARQATIDWHFTISKARDQLQCLYPQLSNGQGSYTGILLEIIRKTLFHPLN